MAIAQGNCPGCGAPIEFGLGASMAKICDTCHSTVVRSDRGLQDLGKVAALADTPCIIAVGDQGTLARRPFEVLGRVQLDYGLGPWDEYYVALDHGKDWGWLAYAQGRWYVTTLVPNLLAPPRQDLRVDVDYALPIGKFSVAEARSAKVVSAEGELPGAIKPGTLRYYADAYGPGGAFATFDYDDGTGPSCIYAGWVFPDSQLSVTRLGPRTVKKIKTSQLQCPNCGGEVPKLHEGRSERLGCPYCGAVSDIPTRTVVAQQEKLLQTPDIPVGNTGIFESISYTCLAYIQRSTKNDGERYGWDEYLLFNAQEGYRWLVKDPETGWSWVAFVSPADIDRSSLPNELRFANQTYRLRNTGLAQVDYVLGEVYWKCSIGESVSVMDFASGSEVISREQAAGEVNYSHSRSVRWPKIAAAFGLPAAGSGGSGIPAVTGASRTAAGCGAIALVVVLVVVLVIVLAVAASSSGDSLGGPVFIGGGSSYRGGGSYSGGK
jgi:hypothetical protein